VKREGGRERESRVGLDVWILSETAFVLLSAKPTLTNRRETKKVFRKAKEKETNNRR